MLGFLRNYSVKIVYGIIITFVVTTFLGVVFFNESFKASRDVQEQQFDRQNAIATLGELSITNQMYQLELRRITGFNSKRCTPLHQNYQSRFKLRALSSGNTKSFITCPSGKSKS